MENQSEDSCWAQRLGARCGVSAGRPRRARAAAPSTSAGRVVVITGGSRGLGLVLARQLAAEGARLCLLARDERELERAAAPDRGRAADAT